jgi:hypothetical protein
MFAVATKAPSTFIRAITAGVSFSDPDVLNIPDSFTIPTSLANFTIDLTPLKNKIATVEPGGFVNISPFPDAVAVNALSDVENGLPPEGTPDAGGSLFLLAIGVSVVGAGRLFLHAKQTHSA